MCSLDAERALLCSVLVEPRVIDDVLEHVNEPEAFHSSIHRKIFKAILTLYERNEAIDLVTVVTEVGDQHAAQVADVVNAVATSANAVSYAKKIKERYILKNLQETCNAGLEMIKEQNKPVEEIISTIDVGIAKASSGLVLNTVSPISELVFDRFQKYHNDAGDGYKYEGVKTGYIDLDNLVEGFGLSENIIIAARPSMGKTALALNIARNVAGEGIPVVFFSLEMRKERIADRLLCAEAKISPKAYRYRVLRDSDVHRLSLAMEALSKLPLEIVDGSMSTPLIRSIISKRSKKKKKMVAFIDFLTLLTDHSEKSPHERYGTIAKKIQRTAIEFNIPIVTLAQLSRKVEDRTNKRPILSDLRESGNIEEAADKVIFIYRDEYYYGSNSENRGVAEIITAKNRDGETGTVELRWTPEIMQFQNISRRDDYAM